MIKWQDKEIDKLSNNELLEAKHSLEKMENFREEKKQDRRFKKRFERQPEPTVNPLFTELKDTITKECNKRGL